jgi:hypothetical protein
MGHAPLEGASLRSQERRDEQPEDQNSRWPDLAELPLEGQADARDRALLGEDIDRDFETRTVSHW